jgi:segregation and condensation protein B
MNETPETTNQTPQADPPPGSDDASQDQPTPPAEHETSIDPADGPNDGAQADDVQADNARADEGESKVERTPEQTAGIVEAILFTTDEPISPSKIADVGEIPGRKAVKDAIDLLNQRYQANGAAFRIEAIAGGYQMETLPEFNDVLARLLKVRKDSKLSPAAMETLAIIAYRQPILRADVEVIRGVACGEVIRSLMEKHMVKIVGRAEVLGRPMLYGTTRRFLEVFGLGSLDELPNVEQLRLPDEPADARPADPPQGESTGPADGEATTDATQAPDQQPADESEDESSEGSANAESAEGSYVAEATSRTPAAEPGDE